MQKIHFNSKYHNILTKEFLYKEYIINKKSSYQIAKEIGCGRDTVWKYLKKFNIKLRSTGGNSKNQIASNYIDGRCSKIYYCIDCLKKGIKTKICYRTAIYGKSRCYSCASKSKWQNKEYRDNTRKRIFEALYLSPNNPEKLLIKLLNKILPKQYTFVGDGKLIVGGFCPDFVNKDNNKIIEMFGDYWHNLPDWSKRDKRRKIAYKKLGYKTLIIWEHELKDIEEIKERILEFNSV